MDVDTYDELPYADYCFPRTHPEHLAAMSALCGRAAPRFEAARVLELGCARGGNLLPMAVDLPGATFVGVDLSPSQVEAASARAREMGLANVSFRCASVADLDARDGEFDYVVCHGVYSWVPAAVRDAILRVCRACMRPEGVAYVSFNVLPGWHGLRTLRDFLLRHVPAGRAPERVRHARRCLAVLDEALRAEPTPWSAWMRDELALLAEAEDEYLFHEYLEADNEAVYFADFVAAARAHGLAHLADASPRVAAPALRPGVVDPVALAQSVDFATGRRFRAALLVREGSGGGAADAAALTRMHLATRAEADPASPARFSLDGRAVHVPDPWTAAALGALAARCRRPLSYAAMAAEAGACQRLDRAATLAAAAAHARDVLALVLDDVVEMRLGEARYAEEAGLRPVASPWARRLAAESEVVTTLRHQRLEVEPFERAMLPLLDGTRDRAALAEAMRGAAEGGASLAGRCEEALEWFARNALLVA